MKFKLSEAAQKVGISRSSIYRLIDEGKLSATTDQMGRKVVDLSELLRVFGSFVNETYQEEKQENTRNKTVTQHRNGKTATQDSLFSTFQELERLRYELQIKDLEIQLKEKEIALANERLTELKQIAERSDHEKEKLLNLLERQTLLITSSKPTAAPKKRATKATPKKVAVKTVKPVKPTKATKQVKKTSKG